MKTLRSTLSSLVYFVTRFQKKNGRSVRILCYHRVKDPENDYMTVSVAKFREQMKFLREQGYETISLDQAACGKGTKSIVITFDDGYRDNYEHAFPILKEYGFKALIFLIADRVGQNGFLTKEQILEMHRSDFQFGSHTMTHPELTTLGSTEKRKEISESKIQLEQALGISVNSFCYPKGLFDLESIQFVKAAGYQTACCNEPGANNGTLDPYLLKRTEIAPHDTLFDFQKKLAGAYDSLHKMLHWFRGRP